MAIGRKGPDGASPTQLNINLNGEPVEQVKRFVYLGSEIEEDGSASHEILRRIGLASSSFRLLSKPLWDRPEVSNQTKLSVYDAVVLSTLLYGVETWTPLAQDVRRLCGFDMACLRKIVGVQWQDKKTNDDVKRLLGVERPYMNCHLRRRRYDYLGHLLRMGDKRIPKRIFISQPGGQWKRSVGGQKKTFWKTVLDEVIKPMCSYRLRLKLEVLIEMAQDRNQWNALFRDNLSNPP